MFTGRKRVAVSGISLTKRMRCLGGWVTENGVKRYFDPKTFVMVTGTKTIDGVKYTFGSDGALKENCNDSVTNDPITPITSSERTVKNYLVNAMQPVGRTLYIWGGGDRFKMHKKRHQYRMDTVF